MAVVYVVRYAQCIELIPCVTAYFKILNERGEISASHLEILAENKIDVVIERG